MVRSVDENNVRVLKRAASEAQTSQKGSDSNLDWLQEGDRASRVGNGLSRK